MKRIFLFFVVFIYSGLLADNICVVAIFKNEAPYLQEWIEYHKLIGVDHFFLYNHYSSDHFHKVLEPYIEEGFVELIDIKVGHDNKVRNIQPYIYNQALQKAQGRFTWLAAIDIDEFILPMKERDLPSTLSKYFQRASEIYMNWRNFGTSEKYLSEFDQIISHLTACSFVEHTRNSMGKSIVRVEDARLDVKGSPHYFVLKQDKLLFYGDGSLFELDGKPFNRSKRLNNDGYHHEGFLRINHYFTKDEDFWNRVKIPRIKARGDGLKRYYEYYIEFNKSSDFTIIDFLKTYHNAFWKKHYDF